MQRNKFNETTFIQHLQLSPLYCKAAQVNIVDFLQFVNNLCSKRKSGNATLAKVS